MASVYVGQRVMAVCDAPRDNWLIHKGDKGTVVYVDGEDIGVAWDADVNGHECGCPDSCEPRHGWWVFKRDITPCILNGEEFVPPSFDDLLTIFGM